MVHRAFATLLFSLHLYTHISAIGNDECADAIVLNVGSSCTMTAATWIAATESQPAIACAGGTSASANDVWFVFTATTSHSILRVQSGADNDAVVEVLNGGCGSLSNVACADASLAGGLEELTLNTAVGAVYHVRVYWWDYGAQPPSLDFSICAFEGPPSPPNDRCSDVLPVAIATGVTHTFTGTTIGADTIGDYALGSPLAGSAPSVWHAFTLAECAHITVDYCNTLPAFENVWSLLADTCPCTITLPATDFELVACGNGNATIHFDSLGAGTWYLPVLFNADEANGEYSVAISANECTLGFGDTAAPNGWSAWVEGEVVTIATGTARANVRIDVYAGDGRLIREEWASMGPAAPVSIPLPGGASGFVLVKVSTTDRVPTMFRLPLLR
jgi:hypothetical protein